MHNNKCNKKSASLTIELSLLMPGIIAVLIFIIFLGYYFHDKCIIENAMYISLLRSTSSNASVSMYVNAEEQIAYVFDSEVKKRLIGKWDMEKTIKVLPEEIIISVSGKMNKYFSINLSESSYTIRGEKYIHEHYIE